MKRTPDSDFFDEYANQVALRCNRYGRPNSTYATVRVGHARGDAETFYYYTYGTYGIRVEIGQKDEGMQPPSVGIYQIINDVTDGFEWLLNSAAGISPDDIGDIVTSRLNIRVSDMDSGEPLYARLKLDSRSMPIIPYRYTNPHTGCFYWMVSNTFIDTLRVTKFGYEPWIRQVRGSEQPSDIGGRRNGIQLVKLPWHDVQIMVSELDGVPITDPVELTIEHSDTVLNRTLIDGQVLVNLPEGDYRLTFYNGIKHVPRVVDVTIDSEPATRTRSVALSPAVALLAQTFDGSDVIHTSDNVMNKNRVDSLARWELTRDLYRSPPCCLTDTRLGSTPILEDGWDAPYDMFSISFDLSNVETAALVYWINQALEPGHDSVWVEFSTGGSPDSDPSTWEWVQTSPAHQDLAILNWQDQQAMEELENRPWNANPINIMQYHDWERFVIMLDDFIDERVLHFRFHMSTDFFLNEDGIYIDDVYLLASGEAPPQVTSEPMLPKIFSMGQPYPNPFNGILSVRVNLSEAGEVTLALYDIRGRVAMRGQQHDFEAGSYRLTIDAGMLPSSVYFLKGDAIGQTAMCKVLLLR